MGKSLAVKLSTRSLVKRPGRTLFAVLGIAIGIAIVVGIFTLDHNTILGLSQPDARDWRADLKVTPGRDVKEPRSELIQIPGVAEVSAFFQQDVLLSAANHPLNAAGSRHALLLALEPEPAEGLGLFRVVRGKNLQGRGQVLIGELLAKERRLSPGDPLVLARPQRAARRVCIDGTMTLLEPEEALPPRERSYRVAGTLADEGVGRRGGGRLVVLDYADAEELYEDVSTRPEFLVKKSDDTNIETLSKSLGRAWSSEINQGVIVGQAADERAFRNGVRFAGLLALVLGLFVIFHSLSIALLERLREIGTLHALGATRAQIGRVFFLEALTVATVGGALGLLGGLGLARLLLSKGITTLGVGKWVPGFEIPWATVLPLVALGAGIALLGSVYPLLRLSDATTPRAIRGDASLGAKEANRGFRLFSALLLAVVLPVTWMTIVPVVGAANEALTAALWLAGGLTALLVGLPLVAPGVLALAAAGFAGFLRRLWPLSGRLVAATVDERPARLSMAVILLALVTAAYTALHGMTASLLAETEEWAQEAVDDKLFLSLPSSIPLDTLRAQLLARPEIVAVESGDVRTFAPFLILGIDPKATQVVGPLSDALLAAEFQSRRSIVLSGRLARDLEYWPGDSVPVRTGRGTVEDYKVLAISETYGFFPFPDERMYGVVADEWMRRDFCLNLETGSRLALRLTAGTDPDEAAASLRRDLEASALQAVPGWSLETGLWVHDFASTDIKRDFSLFDIILGLTAVLAAIGVLNGQLLSALEREKELGVLRAMGTTGAQITGMVALENLVIGVLGAGLGVVLGLILTPLVVEALQVVSALDLPTRSAGIQALWAGLGAIVCAQIAGLYPAYRMRRVAPARAIRQG
ncbi:MAG: FtsX-like permease family protein [Planctomycetes bacterium]|nr:FtsX-like permease family protein [Planctomycetota bacterium]